MVSIIHNAEKLMDDQQFRYDGPLIPSGDSSSNFMQFMVDNTGAHHPLREVPAPILSTENSGHMPADSTTTSENSADSSGVPSTTSTGSLGSSVSTMGTGHISVIPVGPVPHSESPKPKATIGIFPAPRVPQMTCIDPSVLNPEVPTMSVQSPIMGPLSPQRQHDYKQQNDSSCTALTPANQGGGNHQYLDITQYLDIPQSEAAKRLGIPTSTLSKRWREAVRSRKWPFRAVRSIDKQIMTLLHNVPQGGPTPQPLPGELEAELSMLLRKRQEELRPVIIRL